MEHPGLFFSAADLPSLRRRMTQGFSRLIADNIIYSAEKFIGNEPFDGNFQWVSDEQYGQYAQLYAYFYGYMEAASYIQHYSFAWLLTGDERYAQQARRWLMAPVRDWGLEWGVPQERDGGYATDRLLLGVALGYDWLYDYLSDDERDAVQNVLVKQCNRYWPYHEAMADAVRVDTHASYEIPSYGVACMALLGEDPQAAARVERMARKYQEHFLASPLGEGGPRDDRAIYWVFPLFYEMLFHHAYRRCTGRDALSSFRENRSPAFALYTLCNQPRQKDLFDDNENRAMRASYMQQDCASPGLFGLADYFKDPHAQWCAMRDRNAGRIQFTNYLTPTGQRLLFGHGPFCYLWYDENLAPVQPSDLPLVWHYNVGEGLYLVVDGADLHALVAADGKTLIPWLGAVSMAGSDVAAPVYGQEQGFNWARLTTPTLERHIVTRGGEYALICDLPLTDAGRQQLVFNTSFGAVVATDGDTITLRDDWAHMQVRVLWPHNAAIETAEQTTGLTVGLGKLKLLATPRLYHSVTISTPADASFTGLVLLLVPGTSDLDASFATVQEASTEATGLPVCVRPVCLSV